jgi:methylmalonyl-CoA mutase
MSDDVVGGLDEPDLLQPEQGALALASPEDAWSRADWEKAAAGVLRKTGRLSADDPDDAVWGALARTTYDGIEVPPLGTPDLLAGVETSGRPTRVGDWDVRTRHIGDNAAALDAGVRAVVLDGTVPHEQGASDGQELGWLLAQGAEVLRALEGEGIATEAAFGLVELRVAATVEQFSTIAKLRAVRRLWARLAELSGVADPRTRVHAVTSRPMTSAYDVHVNLLRGTVAAFAAGVGGADAITVVPFDEPTGEVSTLGRRMARNVNALLTAESHVSAVTDPAGGGYAVEKLTDDLCRAAWAELGRIETEGRDAFTERVAGVRSRREADVATRRRPITGLSEFPRPADPVPPRRNLSYRYGAAFEDLRRESPEGHVFLATLGSLAEHTPCARFATNLLAAGGIAVDVAGATAAADDLVAVFEGQAVACLAGTEAAYVAWGREAADGLRAAGAARVVVVSTDGQDWADETFRSGDDAVAFLGRVREALR